MKPKNLAFISSILYAIICQTTQIAHKDCPDFVRRIEEIDKIKTEARTLNRGPSTPAPGSLADTLVIDPNDPSQQPQPPLIFTSGHNPPEPPFGHQQHNIDSIDNTIVLSSGDRIELIARPPRPSGESFEVIARPPRPSGESFEVIARPPRPSGESFEVIARPPHPSGESFEVIARPPHPSGESFEVIVRPRPSGDSLEPSRPSSFELLSRPPRPSIPFVSHREPPFFVKVEPKSEIRSNSQLTKPIVKSEIAKKVKKPDVANSAADSMPGPEPQPLPPSTKPLSEKRDCVVLGRGGHCFNIYPIQNVFDCFMDGGVVAMDIVRCSWVKSCCVPNFFR